MVHTEFARTAQNLRTSVPVTSLTVRVVACYILSPASSTQVLLSKCKQNSKLKEKKRLRPHVRHHWLVSFPAFQHTCAEEDFTVDRMEEVRKSLESLSKESDFSFLQY